MAGDADGRRRLVWFRNDLRVHDNETLAAAVSANNVKVSFLFVYNETWDALTPEGFSRFGPHRKRFIAECVIDLKSRLQKLDARLICAYGDPVKLVPRVCSSLKVDELYHAKYFTYEELEQDRLIADRLKPEGVRVRTFHTHTMLHPDDYRNLDFRDARSYSKFRSIVEKDSPWKVRSPVADAVVVGDRVNDLEPISSELPPWLPEDFLNIPHLSPRGIHVRGGETEALKRVSHYFWEADRLGVYKHSRNGLMELDDSSKLSVALSMGCVSARYLYAEVRRYERELHANSSTLWFLYELLWRDHFHFLALGREEHLFTDVISKPPHEKTTRDEEMQRFEEWRLGKTVKPFVNAAMLELRATGWMSNRMRQNVASYLIFDLAVTWQWGARWFQSCLIDYDCASNWGNWSYVAGAGLMNTPHQFDVDQQAKAYDRNGAYTGYWTRKNST